MSSTRGISEEKLYRFLNNHIAKGDQFTHTSMRSPTGRFYIPDDDLKQFEDVYFDAVFNEKAHMHLTEAPSEFSPVKIDLDFRYMSSDLKRRYTIDQIVQFTQKYMEQFEEWFYELNDEQRIVLIFEKESPKYKDENEEEKEGEDQKEKLVKDGVHIMWPWLVTHWSLQKIVRKNVCRTIGNLFESMKLTNSIYDVIDKQVIHKNNWQLYGSRKPLCTAYELTQIFDLKDMNNVNKIDVDNFLQKNGGIRWLLSQLRIKRSKAQCPPIIAEKQDEIDEQERIFQVQVQVKAKMKREYALTKKASASSNDIEMAKDLVKILNPERASSYKSWIEVGWCLHNIHNEDDSLLNTWIEFSKQDPEYASLAEEECTKRWNHAHDGGLAMGTLCHWAKKDNPKAYFDIHGKHATEEIQKGLDVFMEHEIAVVMKHLFKNEYMCTSYGKNAWYYYNGVRWIQSDSGIHLRKRISTDVYRVFEDAIARGAQTALTSSAGDSSGFNPALLETITEQAKASKKKIKKLRGCSSFKDKIMKECREIFYKEPKEFLEKLDMNLDLIGFENGVYELDTGVFRPGRPEDYMTMTTKIEYKEYSESDEIVKEIMDFFSKIYTIERVREYMLMLLSTFLSGSVKEEKFHIWTGTGSNGKSKMIELFQATIGDYFGTLPISLLTGKRAECISANPHMSRTKGKRFVVLQEPDTKTTLNVGLMKELTGGDTITTRPLYHEPIDFKPQFKIALVANDIPAINPDDEAVWRRVRVAQHISKFVVNPDPKNPYEFKRDNNIANKLHSWAQPFMWLLLQYYKKYQEHGIDEPLEVTKYTQEYQRVQDHIQQFIMERIDKSTNQFDVIRLNETFDEYKLWVKDSYSKVTPKNKTQFKALMDKKLDAQFYDPRRLDQQNKKAGYAANGWYGYKLITKFEMIRREMENNETNPDVESEESEGGWLQRQ